MSTLTNWNKSVQDMCNADNRSPWAARFSTHALDNIYTSNHLRKGVNHKAPAEATFTEDKTFCKCERCGFVMTPIWSNVGFGEPGAEKWEIEGWKCGNCPHKEMN